MPASSSARISVAPGARTLQDQLHALLTQLASTIEHVKNWPQQKADASIHVESTSRLIASIRTIVSTLERVEQSVQRDSTLKESLDQCLIPLDLLELLDVGLNPDCFSRGLLKEATGQLQGLKRRKSALERLGEAVQKGLKAKKRALEKDGTDTKNDSVSPPSKKRKTEATDDSAALVPNSTNADANNASKPAV